jgi:hypothetical protein
MSDSTVAKSNNIAERFYTCPAGFTLMSSEELKLSNKVSTDRPGGCYDANMTFAKPIFLGTPASCVPASKFSQYCSYDPSNPVVDTPSPAIVTAMPAARLGESLNNFDAK